MSEQVTSASDIFSLGSLLCMAATGKSPFAATSAPYTLFNIVHSEPQLDQVPAPLRDLIAGCLRKDPHARPTPAQILDHLGALPVQSQPWPAPIHTQIAEQTRNLVALTSDPEATQIIPSYLPSPSPSTPPPTQPRRTALRVGLAALVAVVVVVAAGITGLVLRQDDSTSAAAPVPTPTETLPALDQLRGTDTCAWIEQALGESLPPEAADRGVTQVAAWRWQATASWGCEGSSGGARMAVEIGSALAGFGPSDAVVNGYAVARRGNDCAFALDGGEPGRRFGITVDTFSAGAHCRLADHVVDRLSATIGELPGDPAAEQSLTVVDPCALLEEPVSTPAGPLGAGVAKSAHVCEWPGSPGVRITLAQERLRQTSAPDRVIDIGDGVLVQDLGLSALSNECRRVHRYRQVGEFLFEVAEVVVSDPRQRSAPLCEIADPMVRQMVSRLPAR